jgi:flavin-dependent dehydrogenase
MDRVLFEVAVCTRGVRAHTDSAVESVHVENGRVSGMWAEGKLYRATLVVAADGAHSRIRQQLGLSARPARKRFGVRAHFQLGPGCEQPPWVDVFVGPGYELYVTPLPEREILVAGLADSQALNEPLQQAFLRWRGSHRTLAARLAGAKQTIELLSSALLTGRARAGVTPGAALLGDAACLLDPITGGGITQALLTAELLAEYVPAKLGMDEEWLWDFDRERRALVRDYEIMTELVLWLSDHQRLGRWILSTLNGSPSLFSHFIGVSGGVKRFWSLGDVLFRANGSGSFSEEQAVDRNWRRLSKFRQAIVNLLS